MILDFEERIERLENILETIIDMSAFDKGQTVLRANRLQILNSSGQLRAALTVNRAGPAEGSGGLYLLDHDGNLNAALSAVPDAGGQLSLFSPDETRRVCLRVNKSGSGIVRAFDADGQLVIGT